MELLWSAQGEARQAPLSRQQLSVGLLPLPEEDPQECQEPESAPRLHLLVDKLWLKAVEQQMWTPEQTEEDGSRTSPEEERQ